MKFDPVEALIFFRLLPSNCLNWNICCDIHSSIWSLACEQALRWGLARDSRAQGLGRGAREGELFSHPRAKPLAARFAIRTRSTACAPRISRETPTENLLAGYLIIVHFYVIVFYISVGLVCELCSDFDLIMFGSFQICAEVKTGHPNFCSDQTDSAWCKPKENYNEKVNLARM